VLTFDQASHTYRWHGQPVPNVTRIIAPLVTYIATVPPDRLEAARQEGEHIHEMVALDCRGKLESVPQWMAGHREAWELFKEETGFECWATEERLYHPLGYAGTPDLVGTMPKARNGYPAVIDLKRTLYAGPAIGLQTASYSELWNRKHGKGMKVSGRYGLQLRPNGTYRLQPYEDADDWPAFLAMLTTYRWREKWAHLKAA
jgi:hypothetical protein